MWPQNCNHKYKCINCYNFHCNHTLNWCWTHLDMRSEADLWHAAHTKKNNNNNVKQFKIIHLQPESEHYIFSFLAAWYRPKMLCMCVRMCVCVLRCAIDSFRNNINTRQICIFYVCNCHWYWCYGCLANVCSVRLYTERMQYSRYTN